jgi:polysaccharide deacetylase family protein (PEP-CTERM system associated)
MINALTIDVEDYFMVSAFADKVQFEDWPYYESRVEGNTCRILNLLDTYNVKATFFILGWVGEHYPQLVQEIYSRGHEIASHGYNHRLAYDLSLSEFREDTKKSKAILEDIIGEAVIGYRAASYSVIKESFWVMDVLIEEGFLYDSSIFPISHDRYGYRQFPRFPLVIEREGVGRILEIPMSTLSLIGRNFPIAGGGYLRLLPAKLIEWAIRRLNEKEGQPAIIYLHPWEIDPDQPKLNGRRVSIFRHYVNLSKTMERLNRLLQQFSFGTIRQTFGVELKNSV